TGVDLANDGVLTSGFTPKLKLVSVFDNRYGLRHHGNATGTDVVLTTPELWQVLSEEAETTYTNFRSGDKEPNDFAIGSFKFPAIKYQNKVITYDPDCPFGEMYFLNTDSVIVEFKTGMSFHQN